MQVDRKNGTSHGKSKRPSDPCPTTASAGVGGSAGRNLRIGGDFTIQQNRIPKSALGLAALGLVLLGYAAFHSGNWIAVQNGSYVGGSVSNSRIEVGWCCPIQSKSAKGLIPHLHRDARNFPAACRCSGSVHSRAGLKALDGGPWKTRISEPRRDEFSRWHGDDAAHQALQMAPDFFRW